MVDCLCRNGLCIDAASVEDHASFVFIFGKVAAIDTGRIAGTKPGPCRHAFTIDFRIEQI